MWHYPLQSVWKEQSKRMGSLRTCGVEAGSTYVLSCIVYTSDAGGRCGYCRVRNLSNRRGHSPSPSSRSPNNPPWLRICPFERPGPPVSRGLLPALSRHSSHAAPMPPARLCQPPSPKSLDGRTLRRAPRRPSVFTTTRSPRSSISTATQLFWISSTPACWARTATRCSRMR